MNQLHRLQASGFDGEDMFDIDRIPANYSQKKDLKSGFPKNKQNKKFSSFKRALFFLLDVLLNAVIIVSLVVLIRFYVISPFRVSGPSMCSTLNVVNGECLSGNGEYIVVNKFLYRDWFGYKLGLPERGDIIVFRPPLEFKDDFFIKRIIGLPGDTVRIKDGYVFIYNSDNPDGLKLEEAYLNEDNAGKTTLGFSNMNTFTVPDENYFVLGDNRRASSDSRHCFSQRGCDAENATPFLPFESVEGKAWVVLWPFSNVRKLSEGIW